MANVIRIKRRVSGIAGAPSALKSAELAHNEVDDTLYVGKGGLEVAYNSGKEPYLELIVELKG